jgi:hypothetical protein
MALPVVIEGANLDLGGNLKVTLPTDQTYVGNVAVFAENDDGTHTGTPYRKSGEVSQDFRQRVGTDTILFTDTFNATAQNTGLWKHAFTTMTMTQSAGFLNVNAAGTSTVSGNYASLQTWRYFPLIGTAPLAVEFTFQIDRVMITNETFQCGLGIPGAGVDAPDGVWFEMTSAGLFGVIRYNSGTAVKMDLTTSIASLGTVTNHKFVIIVGEREIEYWLDDILLGEQLIPGPQGQPFMTTALPLFIMKYNSGVVGASPNTIIRMGDITATLMDISSQMTWANQMASCGLGMQGLNGGTMGSPQVQWSNTALPAAAAATNTTAALGAFLGGIFQMNAPATSATDVIIGSYQNPAGGVNQTPRTIKLRGIRVDLVNSVVAVATTPSTFALAVAWGGTALTLAQAESASFATGTAKARRIQPIGVISLPVGTPAGGAANGIQFDFEAPLVINPGEYVQVVAKILSGTATATEVLQFVVSPNLYNE